MTKAVATLSGGLDSAVAAALHLEYPGNSISIALFFDYGQRAAGPELRAATRLTDRWGVPLKRVELPWLAELAERYGSALMPGGNAVPAGTEQRPGDHDSARAVWVPARNAVFVSIAAAFAETLGAECVVTGFNREEAATFADNSAEFVAAGSAFFALGTRSGVGITAPTIALDKAQITAEARRLGYTAADFWSCYEGGAEPCRRCESCLRSRWR